MVVFRGLVRKSLVGATNFILYPFSCFHRMVAFGGLICGHIFQVSNLTESVSVGTRLSVFISHIICESEWPTFLAIQYPPNLGYLVFNQFQCS